MAGPHWTEREKCHKTKISEFECDEESLYAQSNKKLLVLNTSWIEGEARFNVVEGDVIVGTDEIPLAS